MLRSQEVEQWQAKLYGDDPASDRGVLHSVATWQASNTTLRVIKIGSDSPRSENDYFALRAARMRADALVTTGAILREEPDVRHTEADAGLLAWRRERAGLTEPPRSVVLTSGRGLDLNHPLLRSAYRPLIVTGKAAARNLSAANPDCEFNGRENPGIRDTLTLLRELGCRTVLVEAGPTTTRALYDEPVAIDELLLSIYHAPTLAPSLVGPSFVGLDRLRTVFDYHSEPVRIDEASGSWSFSRWRRR